MSALPMQTLQGAAAESFVPLPLHSSVLRHGNKGGDLLSSSDLEIAKMNSLLDSVEAERVEEGDGLAGSEEEVTVFVGEPPGNLLCPLHHGLFVSPVIAKCGHTFCRSCLVHHVDSAHLQANSCPLDKMGIKHEDLAHLIPNLVVEDAIQGLTIYCKYGCKKRLGKWERETEGGCSEVIKVGKRREHEDVCPYSTMKCPYGDSCPPIRRMHLEEHVKSCSRIPCPHKKVGCPFIGGKDELNGHLSRCHYETIKGYIAINQKKSNQLKKRIKEREHENHILTHTLAQLNNKIDALNETLENKTARYDSLIRSLTASIEGTQKQLNEANLEIEALKGRMKKNAGKPRNAEDMANLVNIDYDLVNLNCKGTFTGHSGPVWGLAVTLDGLLVSASSDSTIKIWDVQNFKCKRTLTGHEGIVHAVVVHGNKLCSGSSDKSIRIWDLETFQCIKVIKIHDNTVCSLATGNGLLFSGSFTEIKVWDLDTYECIQTLSGHNHWVRALTAAADRLFSGSYNIVKIWDMKNFPFNCLRTITGNYGSIYSLAYSKEHKRLLSGTYENKINIYDVEDGYKCTQSLDGHIGAVYTLAVSSNRFFSGSYDSTIKVWNIENFKCLQTLVRHSSSVDALVAVGGLIFSGSADHTVKVWN